METDAIADHEAREQNRRISDIVERESVRLRNFVRSRVSGRDDVDDVLQDVFSELVEAYRLMKPVEEAAAWLITVARNRIIDLFRKKRPELLGDSESIAQENVPSRLRGPDEELDRQTLIAAIETALSELPEEQRSVFIAHELEGISFKQLSEATGVSVNTLLSRKRYAVLRLRQLLQEIHSELGQG